MYSMNGFVNIHPWVSNVKGIVAPVGEASPKALTFSREVGYHTKPSFGNTTLLVFESKLDGAEIPAEITLVDRSLEIASYLYTQAINGVLSEDLASIMSALQTQFGAVVNFSKVGKPIFTGAYWFPESITYSSRNLDYDNEVRIWFADEAFRSECDVYEILVVPPVDDLNLLHGTRASVMELLSNVPPDRHLIKTQELTATRSQTTLVSRMYDWTDKVDPAIVKASYFTVIIYGGAGNNEDLIREALIDYILENSTWSREEWEKVYPDLFKPLEYFITPVWDRYSLSNREAYAGVYSPTLPYREILDYGRATFYLQPETHIQDWSAVVGTIYKSLALVVIGNEKNRSNLFGFEQLWPEYASIPTTSFDFSRMSPETQQFVMHLVEHVKYAEELVPSGDVPNGYSLVVRGGKHYLARTFNKVVYLVWLKYNEFPEIEPVVPPVPADYVIGLTRNYDEQTQDQSVSAVLRKVGDPTPLDPTVVVDWFLNGDWANAQLQDSDSTQLIPVVITNSEVGSATHTVTAQFTIDGVSLSVTATVDLLPLVSAPAEYSLVATYNDDTSVRVQLKLGEQLVDVESLLEGGIHFTASDGESERSTTTNHSDFIIEVQNNQLNYEDGRETIEYTFTATFTPLGGDEITLTVTTNDVLTQPTIDETFGISFELDDPETARFYLRDSDDNIITLPGAAYFEVCMHGSGAKHVDLSTDGFILIPLTDWQEIVAIRYGYTQNGVTKRKAHIMNVGMGQAEA